MKIKAPGVERMYSYVPRRICAPGNESSDACAVDYHVSLGARERP